MQVTARFWVRVAFVGKLLRRQRHTGSVVAPPGRGSRVNYLDVTA